VYVQIGGDVVLLSREIIAIFDNHPQEMSSEMKTFLKRTELNGSLVWLTDEAAKSFVMTARYIYASPISSLTLYRRVNQAVRKA
jgi:hypothetical protein